MAAPDLDVVCGPATAVDQPATSGVLDALARMRAAPTMVEGGDATKAEPVLATAEAQECSSGPEGAGGDRGALLGLSQGLPSSLCIGDVRPSAISPSPLSRFFTFLPVAEFLHPAVV